MKPNYRNNNSDKEKKSVNMPQVLQKTYQCFGCKQRIRISKIDNVPPGQKKRWIQYELDGVIEHKCQQQQQQQQRNQQQQQLFVVVPLINMCVPL